MSFIDELKLIQKRKGLTDEKMAELLGVSRQSYQGTRTGKIRLGRKILEGAVVAFPNELQGALVQHYYRKSPQEPFQATPDSRIHVLTALKGILHKVLRLGR